MEVRFTKHRLEQLSAPRRLTALERSVLRLLVRGSETALCQVENATVTEECVDRCGSLVLSVRPGACKEVAAKDCLLANAEWRHGNTAHDLQDVLLFIEGGYLTLLETYQGDGEIPSGLPVPEDLTMLWGPEPEGRSSNDAV